MLARYLWRRPPRDAAGVASVTGWVMLVAILLAPATRVGYLLYPINLFLWAWMFRRAEDPADPEPAPDGAGDAERSVAVGRLEHLDGVRGGAGGRGGGDHHPGSQ